LRGYAALRRELLPRACERELDLRPERALAEVRELPERDEAERDFPRDEPVREPLRLVVEVEPERREEELPLERRLDERAPSDRELCDRELFVRELREVLRPVSVL
jgi:hypothetical protein